MEKYPTVDSDFTMLCVLSSSDGTHIIDPTNRFITITLKDVQDNIFTATWDGVRNKKTENTFLKEVEFIHPMSKTLVGWDLYNEELEDEYIEVTRTTSTGEENTEKVLVENKNIPILSTVGIDNDSNYYQGGYVLTKRGEISFPNINDYENRVITVPFRDKYNALLVTVPAFSFKIQGSLFYKISITTKDAYFQDADKVVSSTWNKISNVKLLK